MSLSYLPGFRRAPGRTVERVPLDSQSPPHNREHEISRLLSAALVSRDFAELLLRHPAAALAQGYQGVQFRFCAEDSAAIALIRAASVQDFAVELAALFRAHDR